MTAMEFTQHVLQIRTCGEYGTKNATLMVRGVIIDESEYQYALVQGRGPKEMCSLLMGMKRGATTPTAEQRKEIVDDVYTKFCARYHHLLKKAKVSKERKELKQIMPKVFDSKEACVFRAPEGAK